MSYKVDKKKSNKLSKILIASGLALTLAGAGNFGITILSQMQGTQTNNDIIEQVVVNDIKQEEQTNEINVEPVQEEYTPKYDINELKETYPNAWGILEKPDGTAQDPPHLQMSHLPAEDPGSERQGQDRDPLSQMPDPVHQEELKKIS